MLSLPLEASTCRNVQFDFPRVNRQQGRTSTSTTRFSSPSLQKEWLCSWPFTSMRFQRSCSMVMKALWICAYFETR